MQAMQAQTRLVTLYAAQGDHGAATLLGRKLLSIDPCNELVHRQLMVSYALSSQNHLALLQYHRCREALWNAFRARPSPETVELYQSLHGPPDAMLTRTAWVLPSQGGTTICPAHPVPWAVFECGEG